MKQLKSSTFYLLLSVIPTVLNWGVIFINFFLNERYNQGYADGERWVEPKYIDYIELPNIFSGFYTQFIWTMVFFALSVYFTVKNMDKSFDYRINMILIPFLYFITLVGSWFAFTFFLFYPPHLSAIYLVILALSIVDSLRKKSYIAISYILIFWPLFANIVGSTYVK